MNEKPATMKPKNKTRIVRFTIQFCIFILGLTVPLHFFSSKGMGPLPWSEILSFWYIWLPTSILGAAWCTFEFDDEPLFWEKFKKKGK